MILASPSKRPHRRTQPSAPGMATLTDYCSVDLFSHDFDRILGSLLSLFEAPGSTGLQFFRGGASLGQVCGSHHQSASSHTLHGRPPPRASSSESGPGLSIPPPLRTHMCPRARKWIIQEDTRRSTNGVVVHHP